MTEAKAKQVLNQLLKDPNNCYCADCKTSHNPRWASWSLGVFICIKCAGTHRSLGTHISKVKSVDLDTWGLEHVEKLVYFKNNGIANTYYEGKLTKNSPDQTKYIPNQSQLSSFIRTKYEMKKWVDSNVDVKALVKQNGGSSKATSASTNNSSASLSSKNSTTNGAPTNNNTLLDLNLNAMPSSVSLKSGSSSQAFARQPTVTSPTSVPSIQRAPNVVHSNGNIATKSNPNNANKNDNRPELKKSILSLYAKPASASTSQLNSFQGNFKNTNMSNNSSMSNLFPSNTHSSASSVSSFSTSTNLPNPTATGSNTNNSNVSLEDNDLFKNVWG